MDRRRTRWREKEGKNERAGIRERDRDRGDPEA